MSQTSSLFTSQWSNPSDVSTVLMIIGGDVVRTALAQSAGTPFTPVCFSFGWVSYTFISLINVLGDGRLLPPPDFPVKVFNLDSGYSRTNQHWVLGRILRDHESRISTRERWDKGIRISIFDALENRNHWTRFSYDWIHAASLAIMIAQFAIASIPWVLYRDWSIFLITAGGTFLALAHGALPQWVAEKLPNRQHANFTFALTSGNGSKDVMVVRGLGNCLHLEDMAVPDTPRNGTPWEKFTKFAREIPGELSHRRLNRTRSIPRQAKEIWGMPLGFLITMVTVVLQTALWLALLISVAAVKQNTWFLLAVGFIGMFQNGFVAAIGRPNESRNLPLTRYRVIKTRKVMDGLMDLEVVLGKDMGKALLKEFFPGELKPDESDWWEGKREAYDSRRREEAFDRGLPQSDRAGAEISNYSKSSLFDIGTGKERAAASPYRSPEKLEKPPGGDFTITSVEAPADCQNAPKYLLTTSTPSPNEALAWGLEKMPPTIGASAGHVDVEAQVELKRPRGVAQYKVSSHAYSPSWG